MAFLLLGVLQEPGGVLGGWVLFGIAQPAGHIVLNPVGAMAVAQEEMVWFAAAQEGALAWGWEKEGSDHQGTGPEKAQGLSETFWAVPSQFIQVGPQEEAKEPSRGATYLFCHLPGGHSRRKGAPGGHPRWPLVPVPPPPTARAGPLLRLCVPASGPAEK